MAGIMQLKRLFGGVENEMKLNNITYEIEDENTFYLAIDKPYLPYLIYLQVNDNNEMLNLNYITLF